MVATMFSIAVLSLASSSRTVLTTHRLVGDRLRCLLELHQRSTGGQTPVTSPECQNGHVMEGLLRRQGFPRAATSHFMHYIAQHSVA
jgi:hypothetical protein